MTERPEILTIPAESIEEQFQNDTLRPILKMQNNLLVLAFRQYVANQKISFKKLSVAEQHSFIAKALRKDQHFKHFVRGLIAAHFTETEWEVFGAYEGDLNKRMINLIEQRLKSQLADI